jgi:hypothetical protein
MPTEVRLKFVAVHVLECDPADVPAVLKQIGMLDPDAFLNGARAVEASGDWEIQDLASPVTTEMSIDDMRIEALHAAPFVPFLE